jgi:hypothetical protein
MARDVDLNTCTGSSFLESGIVCSEPCSETFAHKQIVSRHRTLTIILVNPLLRDIALLLLTDKCLVGSQYPGVWYVERPHPCDASVLKTFTAFSCWRL